MAKGLEKEYNKLSKEDFSRLLDQLRHHPETIHLFADTGTPFFYLSDHRTAECVLQLHQDCWEFDQIFHGFSDFRRKQLIQSFLIREIQSTNSIENIYSTRQDIFRLIEQQKKIDNRKIISIANAYSVLLDGNTALPEDLPAVRSLYDWLMKGALDAKDKPDGKLFRKSPVYINDGIRNVHHGFDPEDKISSGMSQFLAIYDHPEADLFESLFLSHFMLEFIHPFYDGNGRLGRFLITLKYYHDTGSYLSFAVSTAFNQQKSLYYKAFEEAEHPHMYGSLTAFVLDLGHALHTYQRDLIEDLRKKKEKMESLRFSSKEFSRSERSVLNILAEAELFSEFGVSNKDICEYASVSKRTVLSCIAEFRNMNILDEIKIGSTVYHKLKHSYIQD